MYNVTSKDTRVKGLDKTFCVTTKKCEKKDLS